MVADKRKNAPFIVNWGVTLSGGGCHLQRDFAAALPVRSHVRCQLDTPPSKLRFALKVFD